MAAIAVEGLDVTVDDVAVMAGVSRRTVFRQFQTHDELVAAAVTQMRVEFIACVPGPPEPDGDVQAWLAATAVRLHEAQRTIVGRAFWDLHVKRPGAAQVVTDALGDVAALRREITFDLATGAWHALGASGSPPEWVCEAFSIQLSGFATNVLVDRDAAEAGRICARVLWAVLLEAVRQQRDTH
jgi:AcrR family transcriptional regulator